MGAKSPIRRGDSRSGLAHLVGGREAWEIEAAWADALRLAGIQWIEGGH